MLALDEMADIRRIRDVRLPRAAAGERLPDDASMLPVSDILLHLNHRISLGMGPPPEAPPG